MNWINASERLPDDDQTVLVATDDGEVWVGFHDADHWSDVSGARFKEGSVTHWMEFPEAPQ